MKIVNFLDAVKQKNDFVCNETGAKYRITDNGDVIILDKNDRFLDYVTFNTELMENSLYTIDSTSVECSNCNGSRFEKYTERKQELNRLCKSCNGTGLLQ